MITFLVVLILIIASLLILVVLAQNSKKEGLGNGYLGSDTGASQLIGVRKTSDLLEKITWGLVVALFALTLTTSFFIDKTDQSSTLFSSPNIERAQEQSMLSDEVPSDLPTSPSDTTIATD